jgi:hypothetical protein
MNKLTIYRAAAQIAAMEAKLASLQSRKPADEDYVPGQGIDSKFNPPPREMGGSRSGTATPSGDMDLDLDEEMGLDAATKAADELEKEFGLEIAGRQISEDRERSESVDAGRERTISRERSIQPPKENEKEKEPEMKKQEVFQKGLAGLPKKPSFL